MSLGSRGKTGATGTIKGYMMFFLHNIRAINEPWPTLKVRFDIKAPTLLRDLEHADLFEYDTIVFTPEEFSDIVNNIAELLRQNDIVRNNPYHNSVHAFEVFDRTEALTSELLLSPGDTQLLLIAALFHDFDHCGTTIRKDGTGLTNEEVAASHADAFAQEIGLNLEQRKLLYQLIISTTYGDAQIIPVTKMEKILCFADISGFTKSLDEWLDETIRVLKEIPKQHWPKTIEEWVIKKIEFLDWAQKRAPAGIGAHWFGSLEEKLKILKKDREFYISRINALLTNQ